MYLGALAVQTRVTLREGTKLYKQPSRVGYFSSVGAGFTGTVVGSEDNPEGSWLAVQIGGADIPSVWVNAADASAIGATQKKSGGSSSSTGLYAAVGAGGLLLLLLLKG